MAVSTTSQISPVNERIYHQSNLLGDWKGAWSKSSRPVELKVVSIRGTAAQVEYTHDGHTEKGTADVNGSTLTYGNVTIGTRNGTKAALEFSYGTAKMSAILDKVAATTAQSKLVGSWISVSTESRAATFKVLSITGRDAQVQYTVNGRTGQGIGDLTNNTVMLGRVQITSTDGQTGKVVFADGRSTYSVAVTKYKPPSSSVNKLA